MNITIKTTNTFQLKFLEYKFFMANFDKLAYTHMYIFFCIFL